MRENGERMRKWRGKGESVRKWRGNGEEMRKWRENEEMERYSLFTFPHFLFISPLSIHFLYQTLSQNVKYGTFVVNVTKNLTCWPVSLNKSVLFNIILFCSSKCPKSGLQIWHGTLLHQLILGVLQYNLEIFAIFSIKPCLHLAVFG